MTSTLTPPTQPRPYNDPPGTHDLYPSTGILRYSRTGETYKLIVEADQQIANYYRALMPKWKPSNPQKYGAHISVVRNIVPPDLRAWGAYEGDNVDFIYASYVHEGMVYYWLNVFSNKLEEIRQELGLSVHDEFTLPPGGFTKCFHLTIANRKGL